MNAPESYPDQRLSRRRTIGIGAAGIAALAVGLPRLSGHAAAQDATPEATPGEAPSWDEVDALMLAAAPQAQFLAAEIIDGAPVLLHGLNENEVGPIGSSFKFYVLGTLAQQVEAGTLNWEQIVKIEEAHKSVPGGDLRFVADGTPFTMRYLAERMMQKSDNTATDTMIYLVGREHVEAMLSTMGHHDPSLNIPLLTTREFAFMKLARTQAENDAYFAASVAERRQMLADVIDKMPYSLLAETSQEKPIDINRLEWLASRMDLANAVTWLHAASLRDGLKPVSEIIALETQLKFDGAVWPYVGFKGGSELGVLSGTWLMERNDGRFFILSTGFANPDADIDVPSAVAAMEAGVAALAQAS